MMVSQHNASEIILTKNLSLEFVISLLRHVTFINPIMFQSNKLQNKWFTLLIFLSLLFYLSLSIYLSINLCLSFFLSLSFSLFSLSLLSLSLSSLSFFSLSLSFFHSFSPSLSLSLESNLISR